MTKVKICGLMEKEHVAAAIEAGADAIGFVFAPSKRQITVEKAQELAKAIPSTVWKVGVFVNPTKEELERAYHEVPLDFIQFHGSETPDDIQSTKYPSIKALSIRSEEDVEAAKGYNTDFFLFDAPQAGSGITFDWQLMKGHAVAQEKVILAGGLNTENVAEAIHRVKPYMVDVSSGVERQGKKDEQLIKAFIQTVKSEER
ncbi:phosphoribosylanthranilate isomerase [Psychrobacillus sp. OK032]|uniref:phosphoribosylanthranilate isomerase n=1 Tax=Psychrobacillus sp. OK032 TaxID=1884358 RepID=UPI0008CE3EC4|nr:phosphoribosylanthranilate isomerase [Psychrobacillus sp. OK032]SES10727.1 phosphoribosylanthranilate isomerase [Psychrobacillus sp. OK032]